jgi:hypothetical protein
MQKFDEVCQEPPGNQQLGGFFTPIVPKFANWQQGFLGAL